MPAINFQKQFVEKIAAKEKRLTIRAPRKHPIKRGDVLHLYTGMRTAKCRMIGTAVCTNTKRIVIKDDAPYIIMQHDHGTFTCKLEESALEFLLKMDGFKSYHEMKTFFQRIYGLPFDAVLIEWEHFTPAKK